MNKKHMLGQRKRLKSIYAILAVESFVLLCGILREQEQLHMQAQALSDITVSSYEGQAALSLQKKGIVTGFPDGTFRGNDPVNRVQAAKMLLLAANYTLSHLQNDDTFPDIEKNSWYEQFALNAVRHGLMNGYPNGTFGPASTILRSEFLKMLSNAFQIENVQLYHYSDVPPDAWYATYAGAAEKYNLFLHDKAQLLPSAPMSRDEVSWAIYQMLIFRSTNLVIRTPFDFQSTAQATVPTVSPPTLHAAPPVAEQLSSSSVQSSTSTSVQHVSASAQCTDSDATANAPNGYNEFTKGEAKNLLMAEPNNTFEDVCIAGANVLTEYYCNEQGYLTRQQVNCAISCFNGACSVQDPGTPEEIDPRRPTGTLSSSSSSSSQSLSIAYSKECTDTDSTHRFIFGGNIYAKGTVNGLLSNGSKSAMTDICIDNTQLREFSCKQDGSIQELQSNCPLGCSNGACVSPGTMGTCTDTDNIESHADSVRFDVLGRIFVLHPEEGNFTDEDYCENPNVLNEYLCGTNGRVQRFLQSCTCVDGVCVDLVN